MGAELVAIGHPVISAADPLKELSRFVREVKAAYRPRGPSHRDDFRARGFELRLLAPLSPVTGIAPPCDPPV